MLYLHNKKPFFVKQKGPATDLIRALEEDVWEQIAASKLGLLHTRAQTQGSKDNNENNHPVLGHGWVVTHNGGIWNDDPLFEHFKAERGAAVDSIAINLVLGQGRTVEESLPHACALRGTASVAAVCIDRPDEVVLFRLGGPPVHLYWLPVWSMLVWSSDQDGGKALEGIQDQGFAGFSQSYILPDNTALHLTSTGLKRYTLTPKPYGPAYRAVYSGRGVYGGGSLGFLPGSRTSSMPSTRGTATGGKRVVVPAGTVSLAHLTNGDGLLEDPLFTGSFQEYHYISRYESKIPDNGEYIVPTGYGRWALRRTPDGITREFRPHRRVKRRWELELSESGTPYTVTLPASPETADDLSHLLHLGQVLLHFVDGTTYPTLMCPWCGALRHPDGWKARNYTCEWCCITSDPPKEVTTNA